MHEITLPLSALALLLIVIGVTLMSAYYLGFFVPIHRRLSSVMIPQALGAFALFLLLQLLIMPLILSLFHIGSTPLMKGTFQLISIALVGLTIFAYTAWINKGGRWFDLNHLRRNLALGAASWLIAYPFILLLTQLLVMIFNQWLGFPMQEQLAVNQVLSIRDHPVLLSITIFFMVTLVPLIEETLFRGYLQEALQPFFKPWTAIALTSLVFALFHFSFTQGIDNILILSALFSLSLLLGYLKERQASLWSPIALHAIFNGISLVQILLIK